MTNLEMFFVIMLGIQFFHSIEELANDFHKKFPPFKMSFKFFLGFEISFYVFWVIVFLADFGLREVLMRFFLLLMFANGFWHIVWRGIVKQYVPGFYTAWLFIITFIVYYFNTPV